MIKNSLAERKVSTRKVDYSLIPPFPKEILIDISSLCTAKGAEAATCIAKSLFNLTKSSVFATKSVSQLISIKTPNLEPG